MRVLRENSLFEYIDTLIEQFNFLNEDSNEEGKQTNTLMKEILYNEKHFLIKTYKEPHLAIDLNGLPSIDSLKEDLLSMKEFRKGSEFSFNKDLENKINSLVSFQAASKSKYNSSIFNKNFKTKKSFNIKSKQTNFELSVLEENLNQDNQIDSYKIVRSEYQVAWNNLLSFIDTSYFIKEQIKKTTKEANFIKHTKKEDHFGIYGFFEKY